MSNAEHSVMLALLNAQRPLTVKEIVQRTKISSATVYRICSNSPRILNLGSRPVQFYAKRYDELDAKHILIEYGRPKEGWLDWAEDANLSLKDLLDINTNDTKKRLVRADALTALGTLFLSLSNDLREGAGRPDWRNLLER
jgi:hypothetical protein